MILLMYEPPAAHLARLQAIAGQRTIRYARSQEEAIQGIRDAEIVLGNRFFIQSLPYAARLQWMQSNSVGVDLILTQKALLQEKRIRLTCARGVYDAELAEHTLALVLALNRSLHLLRDDQHQASWRRHRLRTFEGSRCLLLGWGSLAKRIAGYLTALGGVVSAVRNSPENAKDGLVTLYSNRLWEQHLAQTDTLIICLPKTPETRHFVGLSQLRKLPPTAFVINIGRGGTLDDNALLQLVRDGQLAGAALDVFEQEPLPPGHPLWQTPEILISPHAGRSLEGPDFRWFSLFETNLSRYLSGEELLNEVNYDKGY